MNESIDGSRLKLGKQLYAFAWAFEICAVLIGLAIALMQGYSSFEEMEAYNTNTGFVTSTNIFIAAMPFIMVALVEITKIPFVGAFYQAKSIAWKFIFGFTLIFMAAITFESAANGFERNFNALIFGINDFKRNLSATEEKIGNLEDQRGRLSTLTSDQIEAEFQEKYSNLSAARAADAKIVSGRKAELRATTENETLTNLRDEIQEKSLRRQGLEALKAQAVDDANKIYQTLLSEGRTNTTSELRSLQSALQRKQDSYDSSLTQSYKEIEGANIFTRNSVRDDWEERLNAKDAEISDLELEIRNFDRTSYQLKERENLVLQIDSINSQFDPQILQVLEERRTLRERLARSIGTKEKDIEDRVRNFDAELAAIEQRFDRAGDEIKLQRNDALERFDSNSDRIDSIDDELDSLNSARLDLRKEINTRVGNNQVYRMAQMFYGKEQAADIDRQEVVLVASIWFGSLAALIAFTGIMLALASYVLSDQSVSKKDESKYPINRLLARFVNSGRRYFISKRRTQKLPIIKEVPKEIIKEVEVSKVVTVEKPIEVKVREVVHVPFYTNDKKLLNITEAMDLVDGKAIKNKTKSSNKKDSSLYPLSKNKDKSDQ
jgi:hypothetical protein